MLGPFIRIDGKLVSMAPASCGKRAVAIALRDIGYHESPAGSNRQKYGKRYGENGVAWCGLAACSWLSDAGFVITRDDALQHDYVPQLVADARAKRRNVFIVGKNRVRAGDRVCFEFNGDSEPDHVGIFVCWISKRAGTFLCIEGNTSRTGSQSNGGMVVLQTRHMSQTAAFVRTTKTRRK